MSQWIYRIVPTRAEMVADATDEESAVVEEHFHYLQALKAAGILILAGRTQVDEGTFGITIFEAPDEETARAVMETDPAVSAGVMSAELYPYAVAVAREGLTD
ncbi:MAG: YciI family protein [Microbacterium sp.]